MDSTYLYCIDTEMDMKVDILEKSDKHMKVVTDENIAVRLSRNDTRFPYIGRAAGLEFESWGLSDE